MGRDAHQCLGDRTRRPSPLWDGPLYPIRDRAPVNTVGEPCAGKPHARFDEGRPPRHLAGAAAYSTNLLDSLTAGQELLELIAGLVAKAPERALAEAARRRSP